MLETAMGRLLEKVGMALGSAPYPLGVGAGAGAISNRRRASRWPAIEHHHVGAAGGEVLNVAPRGPPFRAPQAMLERRHVKVARPRRRGKWAWNGS